MPVLIPAKKLHSEERLVYLNAQASRRFATSIFSLRFRDQSSNPLKQRQTSVRTTLSSHISLNPAIGVVQMTIYLDQYFTLNLQIRHFNCYKSCFAREKTSVLFSTVSLKFNFERNLRKTKY